MTELKRRLTSDTQQSLMSVASKRPKADMSMSAKERKEKLGERIAALQQLVSPYGKTDTASVLLDATAYIRFLQDQVQVLSDPYLRSNPTTSTDESEIYSLRSKGLCLVPVSCTAMLAGSNGADIWAPIKSTSQRL